MASHLYLIPVIGAGTELDPRRPKYISDMSGVEWSAMDYGYQPLYLIHSDVSDAQHASLIANSDVIAFPTDFSSTIGGGQQLQNARAALEAALIPAQWINAGDTWLSVIRMVAGMFQFMQRLNFYLGNDVMIDSSAKLNARWSQIPVDPYQTAILQTAQSLGYDTSFIVANTQIRTILESFARQWGTKPIYFGGLTL